MNENSIPQSGAKKFAATEERDLVETGTYEIILGVEPKMYGANQDKPGLSCRFNIRGDVQQPFSGSIVFDTIWLDKDTVNWKGWYDHKKLHKILLTQENPKLEFQDCDECIQYINGLCMRVTIEKKFDEYRNADVNEVKYLSYAPSLVGEPGSQTQTNNTESLEMPDSDVPF